MSEQKSGDQSVNAENARAWEQANAAERERRARMQEQAKVASPPPTDKAQG